VPIARKGNTPAGWSRRRDARLAPTRALGGIGPITRTLAGGYDSYVDEADGVGVAPGDPLSDGEGDGEGDAFPTVIEASMPWSPW